MTVRGSDGQKYGKVVGFGSRVILVRKGWVLPRLFHVRWDDIISVDDGVVKIAQHRPELAGAPNPGTRGYDPEPDAT